MSDSSLTPRHSRSRRVRTRRATQLVTVATVAVVASAGLLAGRAAVRGDDSAGTGGGAPTTAAPTATAPAAQASTPPATRTGDRTAMRAAAAGVAARPVSVHYTFDAGAGRPIVDTSGRYPLAVAVAAGGAVQFDRHDSGWAIAFPSPCTAEPAACPRAVLEGSRADELNPGTRPVRLGASIRMTGADTSDGANVVQKGYSVGGSTQIKLQVDGAAGRPSCVVASTGRIYRVVAPVRVADGAWHNVACVRNGSVLGITVDGINRGTTSVPARLSIVNSEPLRVGGKGTNPGNDQYSGDIDDVFLDIS